jgi:DNA-binding PadR family transcriptional regulator
MKHLGGRKPQFTGKKHGEEHERFGDHRRGHRIFDNGDIRYVILSILAENPSHGYELIKAIEERLSGAYSPSPGLVYPTLTMLEELGYISAKSAGDGKKLYTMTTQGLTFLEINKPVLDRIVGRMAHAASLHRRAESPQLVRAIQNLKFTLKLKSETQPLSDEQITAIAEALDQASRKIEQC